MEELYPGEVEAAARNFYVAGKAIVLSPSGISQSLDADKVVTGFSWLGRRGGLIARHPGLPNERQPAFFFRLIDREFLADAIWGSGPFRFAVESNQLGIVEHLSGAAARESDNREQGIVSLQATGELNIEGLTLCLKGNLARPFITVSAYEINLHIPWSILRFMFYEEVGFMNIYKSILRG